ncbi:MAG: arginase family protein [Myxococcota bacterium]
MRPLEELAALLKPAGGGLYLVSTGKAEQDRLQERLYGVASEARVRAAFEASLGKIATAKGVLLGLPSDVGAGFRRGANLGPQAIRTAVLDQGIDLAARGVVDIGDVFVVPQLLHDSMLSAAQLEASRAALYPEVSLADRAALPVSPLSIAERAWRLVLEVNPQAKLFALGGDHSCTWPVVPALQARAREGAWGIVQSDAHTDLLETRLGVTYCFGTWSYHANDALGRKGRLTQVGIRATRKTREHWESTLGVRQFWAEAVRARPKESLDEVLAHVKASGVSQVYFSNDIDGTDAAWADATGTPEPRGLEPDWLVELIRRLGREVGLLGGDVMEVAPDLAPTPESRGRTLSVAVRYLDETIDAALGRHR